MVILSGLVAAQDDIVNSVMKQDSIAGFLLSVLSNDATPDEVRLPALDLVMDLAEDNLALAQLILSGKENNTFKGLHRLALGQGPASAPACGILHSVFAAMQWHDQNKGEDGACDAILVDPLSRIISHVARDPSSIAKEDVLSGSLHSVRQALEILADIGTYLLHSMKGSEHDRQEEPEWNGFSDDEDAKMEDVDADNGIADSDAEEEEDDGSDDMEDIEADMEMVTAFDDPEPVNGIDDLQTLSQLLQKAVPHLITISNIVYDNEDARMIREMALSVLGNLAWTVSSLDFSDAHNAGVQRAWTPVAMKIWKEIISTTISSNTTDLLLARRVASLAWAVSRSLHGEVPLAADEHQRVMSLYQATKRQDPSSPQPGSAAGEAEDPFLETGVMCVGVLGQLALPPAPLSVNRDIGIFLLTIVSSTPQSPPADVVEALGQLFDIYADEDAENDQIFWELKFLDHLEEVQPKIKAMVKSLDKRKVPELRNRADEAVLNLGRFIQYKRKHRPQMKVNGSGM